MSFKQLSYIWLIILTLGLGWLAYKLEQIENDIIEMEVIAHNQDVPSIQMYSCLEKYSKEYKIPRHIIHNIAFRETTYRGPFDWKYNPARESGYGAVGPMQVTLIAAKDVYGHSVNKKRLKEDIDFNIKTSAAYLNKLYKRFNNWDKVVSFYSAYDKQADYVVYVTNNKNYKNKWLALNY